MASFARKVRRMVEGKSKSIPLFTEKQLAKLPDAAKQFIASVEPDTEEIPAELEPEVVAPPQEVKHTGTYCTLKDGTEFGPFKNQAEAKAEIKAKLGVPRMPAGATFTRV